MKDAPRPLRALVLECLRQMRAPLVLAVCALAGVMLTDLLAPWPIKIIFDHILLDKPLPAVLAPVDGLLAQGDATALLVMAASIALIALLAGACAYVQVHATAKVGHYITWRLRSALFAHLQRLSLGFHHRARSGELITKVASDTNLLRDVFAEWALTFTAHGLTLIAMLAVMFALNTTLALVVSTTLPPMLFVIYVLNRRVKASVRAQRRYEGAMAARLGEVLSTISLVRAFGREQIEAQRFREEITGNFEAGVRTARSTGAITRAIVLIGALGTAVTVYVGARQVVSGALTPGELLIFMAYVSSLFKPVKDLGRLSAKFSRAAVSAGRISDILSIAPEPDDAPDALTLRQCSGEIVFDNVSFAYDDGQPVLHRVNLRIGAGERVALVGPSGAGKSTLMALLLRLYEPTEGRILVDGVDIRRYRRESLRQQIGIVLQETVLFGVSVRENIAYGCPDATDAAIETAAQAARAHEFIVDLPEGYDTELGERGATLSGGQRQRICLARALVKQPSILIMDEPTSAVDAISARLMHESVALRHAGKTLLVIAHDYADMNRYDRVVVLEHGRVVESGPHDALLAQQGTYLKLVNAGQ